MNTLLKSFSVRELGALGSAAAVAIIAWLYFPDAFTLSTGDVRVWISPNEWQPLDKSMLLRFAIGAAFLLLVIELVYRAILARFMWREFRKMDERDRFIALRARSIAYHALLAGSAVLTAHIYLAEPPGFLIAQYVLLLLCAAEFVKYSSTFVLYRLSI